MGIDRAGIATCHMNLGIAYERLGDVRKAVEQYQTALKIYEETKDKSNQAKVHVNLAGMYASVGNSKEAVEKAEKALQIFKDIGDKVGESKCYTILGGIYADLRHLRKSMEYFNKSLGLTWQTEDKHEESACYLGIGNVYYDIGEFTKAMGFYEKSLETAKDIGAIDLQRITNLNLGLAYNSLDKAEIAFEYCKRSIELSEMLSGKLVEEEHEISFAGRISDAYQFMVPLCLWLEKVDEAFEYAERTKSRVLLDLLSVADLKPSVESTSELNSLIEDEEANLAKLREIQTRHLRQTQVSVELWEVEGVRRRLDEIWDKIEKHDPEYVCLRRRKPLSPITVGQMLASEKTNAILIEYFITRDETFIFVVSSKEKQLHIKSIPVSEKKLSRYVEVYEREVVDYHGAIGDTWLDLSSYLIEPIAEYLTGVDLVYLVPYGPLHYLPMHALELNGEPLIKSHPVAYSPSASLLKFCFNKGSGKFTSCACFGVEFFKDEAKRVAAFFDAELWTDAAATREAALENCTNKDVIHFSCHGYFDNLDPLSSGVELDNGVLTAREIFGIRLNTELVTLSACQTGLNKRSPGDELIGLTRAFLYAGTPSVIVSLWSVDAGSTQELMLEFYRLLKNGLDKATALQEAQKKIMGQDEYSHPYYWAPFVLVGNYK